VAWGGDGLGGTVGVEGSRRRGEHGALFGVEQPGEPIVHLDTYDDRTVATIRRQLAADHALASPTMR